MARERVSETLKLASGTNRPPRPKPPAKANGKPVKPSWLGEIASVKWDETVALMLAEETLTPTCADFLTMFCVAIEDFHNANDTIANEGEYCHSEKGGVYQHPAVGVRNKAIDRIMKFGRQLGLSPATSAHVQKASKKEAVSSKNRFFGKNA